MVLRTAPSGEFDRIITLYTKELGLLGVRAVGSRRITSKLSEHLNPLNLIHARLVHKNQFTVTSALTIERLGQGRSHPQAIERLLALVAFLEALLPVGLSDLRLWYTALKSFRSRTVDFSPFLKLLGYDPKHASCAVCASRHVTAFTLKTHEFMCAKCASRVPRRDFVWLESQSQHIANAILTTNR